MAEKRSGGTLALKRKKGSTASVRPRMSLYLINKMFELYCEGLGSPEIAKQLGVDQKTVVRYILIGRPSHHIEPFKERRERLLRHAFSVADANIVSRLSRVSEAALLALEEASLRYVDRVKRAGILEDPELYKSGAEAVMAAREAALNPDASDVASLTKAAAQVLSLERKSDGPSVSVSVNQTQEQATASLAANADGAGIDLVREYVSKMQSFDPEKQREAAAEVLISGNARLEKLAPSRDLAKAQKCLRGAITDFEINEDSEDFEDA